MHTLQRKQEQKAERDSNEQRTPERCNSEKNVYGNNQIIRRKERNKTLPERLRTADGSAKSLGDLFPARQDGRDPRRNERHLERLETNIERNRKRERKNDCDKSPRRKEGRQIEEQKPDLYLYDSKTNELLDEKKNKSLMRVPYYTQRGTFIHNGNEYSTLRQLRLRPGMYTRKKANGELETQFNIERGTGQGYRIIMDPATGIYKFNIGQSNSNLYSLLHDMGVPDQDLINAWGIDIFKRNKAKYDARALEKVHSKLVGKKSKATNRTEMAMELKNAFDTQRVDADIKQFNLGL